MKLSKRLKTIADLIDTKKVIDIGCDHGYLDIYLTLYKDCTCIATDISSNAIKTCQDNISKYHLEDKIETYITDGLNGINITEDDALVLSGMGTKTIIDILRNKKLSNTIIISSNNNLEELRRFMVRIGYYIDNEIYIYEHNIHYVIIKFIKGYKEYNDYDYLLGPIAIKDNNYKTYILNHYNNIYNKIPKTNNDFKKYYQNIINYVKINFKS